MRTKSRLSTKGQLIIPREIRKRHGWRQGTELEVEDRGDAVVLRATSIGAATTVDDLIGFLRYRGAAKTLRQMAAGIARGARKRR